MVLISSPTIESNGIISILTPINHRCFQTSDLHLQPKNTQHVEYKGSDYSIYYKGECMCLCDMQHACVCIHVREKGAGV